MNNWNNSKQVVPRDRQIVEVAIIENGVERNLSKLMYYRGMWWTTDGIMYVYWTPTHWREI